MANLLNRVKVSTSTVGTGLLALGAADTGFQAFAAAGAINGAIYDYVIEEGSNWEIGEGVYGSAGPSLTRTVLASSAGGTSAISLTGTAKVYISPNVRTFPPVLGKMTSTVGYIHPLGPGDSNGTNILTADMMYGAPFILNQSYTVDRLGFRVHNTAVAASNAKVGIYACPNNSSYPTGLPILDSGNLSTVTANTERETTGLNTRLPPGLYIGLVWVSAAIQVNRADSAGRSYRLGDIPAFSIPTYATFGSQTWRRSTAYGSWPSLTGSESDWLSRGEDNTNCPAIVMGVI